jgi:cysteinyl-tRNA synthetase
VATEAVLEMEATLHAWSADTFQSDELDRARAALRRMVVRLGELAAPGLRDPRDVLAPWVEALLVERTEARQSGRFADGDRIRQRLEDFGVEVRDTPTGTDWGLRAGAGA